MFGLWIVVAGALIASSTAFASHVQAQTAPPEAPEPSIFPTIEPSTDLVEGQVVTVSASDLPAGATMGLAQCDSTARGTESCDLANTVLGNADDAGEFSAEFTVHRQIQLANGLTDCAVTQCIIGIGVLGDDLLTPQATGGAVISFDPSAPLPDPPSVTLSKSKNLKDGQKIRVEGAGWSEDSYDVNVEQCATIPPAFDPSRGGDQQSVFCRYLGGAPVQIGGDIEMSVKVHRTFYAAQKRLDCASDGVTCELVLRSYSRQLQQVSAALSFDASLPLPPKPQLDVKPRRGLVEGQLVEVSVSNFDVDGDWNLVQCITPNGEAQTNGCTYLPANFSSSVVEVEVSRALVYNQEIFDCAIEANSCSIVLMDYASGLSIKRGLSFEPTDEPVTGPLVTFSDNVDSLVDGATVSANVAGPFRSAMLTQCPKGLTQFEDCSPVDQAYDEGSDGAAEEGSDEPSEEVAEEVSGEVSEEGVNGAVALIQNDFSLSGNVRRVVWYNGESVDCAAEPGACVLVAWNYELGAIGEPVDLTFLDEGPVVLPTVKVKKKNLVPNEVVTARFKGMPGNSYLEVMQCAKASLQACLYLPGRPIDSANFSFDLRVRQFVQSPTGQIDCAAVRKACELRFSTSPGSLQLTVPLRFDADAPPAPGPELTVSPSKKLSHLQSVELTVENVFGYFGVAQCPIEVTNQSPSCTYLNWDEWDMDEEAGNSTAKVKVRRILSTPTGRVDCAEKRNRCKIIVVDGDYNEVIASKRIRFNAKADAPPPPALIVSPVDDLVDGQDVEIIARTDGQSLNVQQCAGAEVGQYARRCRSVSYSQFDGNPRKFIAGVSRKIIGNDCAEVPCSIVLTSEQTGVVEVAVPLSFDPDGELLGAPTLAVSPRTGLADRQTIEATVSGSLASQFLQQCVVENGKATTECISIRNAEQQTLRSVTVTPVIVRRMIDDHDCASVANSCALVVVFFDQEDSYSYDAEPRRKKKLLTFDPNATPLPGPTVAVSPATGLSDGDLITVEGGSWGPNSYVYVGICAGTGDVESIEEWSGSCADEASASIEADSDGNFSVEFAVPIEQTTYQGDVLDCREGCVVLVTNGYDVEFFEISFDGDSEASATTAVSGLAWPESLFSGLPVPINGFAAPSGALGE